MVADRIKVANQMPLKLGDYLDYLEEGEPKIFSKVPPWEEEGRIVKSRVMSCEKDYQPLLALKMEEGAMSQGVRVASRS